MRFLKAARPIPARYTLSCHIAPYVTNPLISCFYAP